MRTIRHLLFKATRKSQPVCSQMELSLPGSRLTREEAQFLRKIRQLREEMALGRS